MIDAWEIVGRLATDRAFATTVFGAKYTTPYQSTPNNRAVIPGPDYDALRKQVRTKIAGPVSLMALGELLVAMRLPGVKDSLDKLAAAIDATGVKTAGRSPMFYAALGASLVDMNLRTQIPGNFGNFGFNLGADEADATKIITDPGVQKLGQDFCKTCWSEGCLMKTIFWPAHVHPFEFTLKM
jgi:hypothetical protein